MQKQSQINRYWQKDNFFKTKQTKSKSTISDSFKGFCTNILYKLGGQSILSRKGSSNFDTLALLGKRYVSYEMAQRDFKSLYWFTYRKQLKINGQKKSDLGWGCLIRVGQMLLANCLKRYFQYNDESIIQENIVVEFLDDYEQFQGKYSFQRILKKGKQKFQLQVGEWFNISQICYVLMSLQNTKPMKGSQSLKMVYFNQTLIFLDEVFQKIGLQICRCEQRKICCHICNGQVNYLRKKSFERNSHQSGSFELVLEDLQIDDQQHDPKQSSDRESDRNSFPSRQSQSKDEDKEKKFDLLLVVSTRISQSSVDQKSYQGILELINLPTSLGMIGGVPRKGLYFVGSCDQNLIYLDPHLVQTPVNTYNFSKQLSSFHCENLRLIDRQKLDPSIAFAFYIKSLNQMSDLIEKIEKLKCRYPEAVPISYMWENEYKGDNDIKSNQIQIQDQSPDFSFVV